MSEDSKQPENQPEKQKELVDTGNNQKKEKKEKSKPVLTQQERDSFASLVTVEYNGNCYVRKTGLLQISQLLTPYVERIHRVTLGEIADRYRSHYEVSRSQFKTLYDIVQRYKNLAAEHKIEGVSAALTEADRLLFYAEEKVEAKRAEIASGSVKVVDKFSAKMRL